VQKTRRDQPIELSREQMRALRRQVEAEQLHRDGAIGIRLARTEDRTQCSRSDLMKNPKWPEGVRSGRAGSVRVQ
jgi:hypothetical protein